jgi:hypothetical protein
MLLRVRVTPKSAEDSVMGLHRAADGTVSLAVKVAAPPDKGQANKAVIATVAKAAGLPRSTLEIVAGETERNKTILLTGDTAALAAFVANLENAEGD